MKHVEKGVSMPQGSYPTPAIEIWPEVDKRLFPIKEAGFKPGHLRSMLRMGMIPHTIQVRENFHLTLSEAVWLKIALHLMEEGYDVMHIRFFQSSFFSMSYHQGRWESEASFQRRLDRGEGTTGMDQLLSFAFIEQQEVELRFNKVPQLGIFSSFGRKGNLTSSTFHSVSLTTMANEVLGNEVLKVRENRHGTLSSAEEEFVLASRESQYDEFLLTRVSKDGRLFWDLTKTRKSTGNGQELHDMLEKTRLGFGVFSVTGQGGKPAVYRLDYKLRLK